MSSTGLIILGLVIGLLIGMSSTLISTFTLHISAQFGKRASANKIAIKGLLLLLYCAMLLVILSAIISTVLDSLSTAYQQALIVAVPVIAILIGLSFIRRYFWHEPVMHITHAKRIAKTHSIKSTHFLQPFIVACTLLYIIGPVILVVLFCLGLTALLLSELPLFWYVPFALGVITPLYGILALLSTKTKASKILLWNSKIKSTMHLYTGFCLILLAWIVFYVTVQQGGL